MKLKNILFIVSILTVALLFIGCVSATQDNSTLSIDDESSPLMQDNTDQISANESSADAKDTDSSSNSTAVSENTNSSSQSNSTQTNTTTKISKKTINAFCSNAFIQKSNKYFTVKLFKYNEKTNKLNYFKNVKITVKVKINGKTKTYNVKTNSKGEAKVLNIKNLKIGLYKVSVSSNDKRYTIKENGYIGIFSKSQKQITLKVNTRKKIKNGYIDVFHITKNSEYPKGVYVDEYNAKNPQGAPTKIFIMKTKFFFKNKKTGKIISKTVKTKAHSIYGQMYPHHKLISGYKPVKATVWYATY